MSGQIVSLQVCKVTLVTFVWLFSSVFFKCVLKWHDREDAKSQKLHLSDFFSTVHFKMCFQIVRPREGIFALVAFFGFSSLCIFK